MTMNRAERRQVAKVQDSLKYKPGVPPPEGKQWVKCLFPPCPEQVLVEKEVISPIITTKPKQMTLPMCKIHGEMCMFMMWLLPQLQIQRGVTPGGIVVPPGGPATQSKAQEQSFLNYLGKKPGAARP